MSYIYDLIDDAMNESRRRSPTEGEVLVALERCAMGWARDRPNMSKFEFQDRVRDAERDIRRRYGRASLSYRQVDDLWQMFKDEARHCGRGSCITRYEPVKVEISDSAAASLLLSGLAVAGGAALYKAAKKKKRDREKLKG